MLHSIYRVCCPLTCGVSLPSLPAPVSVSLSAADECGLETALRGGGVPAGWIGERRLAGCSNPAAQRDLRGGSGFRGKAEPPLRFARPKRRKGLEREGVGKRRLNSAPPGRGEEDWRDKARERSAPCDLGEGHDEPA